MEEPFYGVELLLFRQFQQQPSLWYELVEHLRNRVFTHSITDLEEVCANLNSVFFKDDSTLLTESLEFIRDMIHKRPKHLIEFVKEEIDREHRKKIPKYAGLGFPGLFGKPIPCPDATQEERELIETLMMRYLNLHNFTELSLDGMFKFGDDNRLPREIFRCPNVKYLSLKFNSLEYLPCDIGRMSKLEYLALTNNKLSVWSLPFSLTFLTQLRMLYLDNNLLDALPGFLPYMPALETVHRHGNHNYFKSTFMWYHTDVNLRIIPVTCEAQPYGQYESLQFWAAKTIIGSKHNFFEDPAIVPVLKDYIADIYRLFNICHHCNKACFTNSNGFKVITFKNPYLGNTCVPFQHWACSRECAKAVEIPARLEQISAARELDLRYENYIKDCIRKFSTCHHSYSMLSCASVRRTESDHLCWREDDLIDTHFKCAGHSLAGRDSGKSRRKTKHHRSPAKAGCGCEIS